MEHKRDDYFSQFKLITRFEPHKNCEIYRVKMLLFSDFLSYPKYACIKIIDPTNKSNIEEVSIMAELCQDNQPGILSYYHHIYTDKLLIFIEDCFDYLSGFDDISLRYSKIKKEFGTAYKSSFIHRYLYKNFFEIVDELMMGLKRIHQAGYIHSDIAPKNILISSDKKYKIGDFGAAVKKNDFIFQTTSIYLSPENREKFESRIQIQANEEIDCFALGKSIFELLVLKNQIDLQNFSQPFSVYQIFRNFIEIKRLLDSVYADTIIDIMMARYKGREFYEAKKTHTYNQTSKLKLITINEGYCAKCKQPIRVDQKYIVCICKHHFHLNGFCEKKLITYPKCPICQEFIGSEAIKRLLPPSTIQLISSK